MAGVESFTSAGTAPASGAGPTRVRALSQADVAALAVSVVGFDDVAESGYFLPPLTTVHQDFEEVGRRCVTVLLDQIGGHGTPNAASTIPLRLVHRESTAPPREDLHS